jgi:hypothetical protein
MIVDPTTVRSVVLYDGPMLLSSLVLIGTDSDPLDFLEDAEPDELVCMEWSNVSMTMTAATARAWLENAIVE